MFTEFQKRAFWAGYEEVLEKAGKWGWGMFGDTRSRPQTQYDTGKPVDQAQLRKYKASPEAGPAGRKAVAKKQPKPTGKRRGKRTRGEMAKELR
jgi:hypothetical protein